MDFIDRVEVGVVKVNRPTTDSSSMPRSEAESVLD